ncbi:unnamed protein product [Rotaria sp. Silwood2]|nr:unnamed protein product [Rotaria sp. Silwood2]
MDNIDIEIDQLIDLSNERFFEHIEERYGIAVAKILKYHDIDRYKILSQVDEHQLIDFFEKPNDEHSTSELVNLKNEICNISQESITLKVGTKAKVVSLLKSAQFIVKKKKFQVLSQARSNRLDNHQSSLSSTDNNVTDSEVSKENNRLSIEESIEKLLKNINYNIHGKYYTNISTKDFKVIIENTSDPIVPTCSIECICNERIKLYLKSYRFQLSNFMKHLKVINNKPTLLINNINQQLDGSSNVVNQMNFDDQALRNESNRPTAQNYSIQHHTNNSDLSASVTIKKTLSQNNKSRAESNNRNRDLLATIKKNHQPSATNLPKEDETQSSISFTTPSNPKTQLINNRQKQTTNSSSNYQHFKSLKDQNVNQSNSSQSKKRKLDQNDRPAAFSSLKKNNNKLSEQNISSTNTNSSDILCTLLNTIDLNRHRSSNNYRYSLPVLRFATCLFILAGIYVYEYIRLNLKFLLPSIQTVKKYYTHNPFSEAKLHFKESKNYLDSIECQFIFLSEDCSAIIPKIEYDSTLNTFNGFVTPLLEGIPIENTFNYESFEQLKLAIETKTRAKLVNVHLIQPIYDRTLGLAPPPSVLAAYGTDNKQTSIDIVKKWIMIYQEFFSRNIRVLGFSTDGDPKFLRSMRIALNFFVKIQTLNINNNKLSFTINIPSSWSTWYFLNRTQLFLCMQDGIHLCCKIRNRLLSKNAKLKMGSYNVSIIHLHQLIKTTNKIDHNLCKSDLNIRDRQNFSSCQRISDDKVLIMLSFNEQYKATYNYLLLLNLLIMAYTNRQVSLLTRIYYAWIVLFFVRLWRLWLYLTKRKRKSTTKNKTSSDQYFFITSNALLSIEINAHCLIYIYLLIEQKFVPESLADSIHIFSSQPCESVFRDARALSGVYSTQINFTMKQFLKRVNKLNALTELKQLELTNKIEKIYFPIHHKIKRLTNQSGLNITDEITDFNSSNIEKIIVQAYEAAQDMAVSVGMSKDLIKYDLFDMEQSSQLAEKLLRLNNLTETEILIIDGSNSEDSDEEDIFDGYDFEERLDDEEEEEKKEEEEDDDDDPGLDGDEEDNVDDEEDHDEVDYDENNEETINDDIDESDENTGDYDSSEDDAQPTITFENVQATSFSGVY